MMDRISTLERVDLIPDDVRTRVFIPVTVLCVLYLIYIHARIM